MRTGWYHKGRFKIIKCTKTSTKQTDEQAITATEQANIAVVQVAAEAARVAVQAMAIASANSNQRAQNVGSKLG